MELTKSFKDWLGQQGYTVREGDDGFRVTKYDENRDTTTRVTRDALQSLQEQFSQSETAAGRDPTRTIDTQDDGQFGTTNDTVQWFNQRYGTNFKDRNDYLSSRLYPGGSFDESGRYYTLPEGYTVGGATVNPALSYDQQGSFLDENGWAIPLAVVGAGMAYGGIPGVTGGATAATGAGAGATAGGYGVTDAAIAAAAGDMGVGSAGLGGIGGTGVAAGGAGAGGFLGANAADLAMEIAPGVTVPESLAGTTLGGIDLATGKAVVNGIAPPPDTFRALESSPTGLSKFLNGDAGFNDYADLLGKLIPAGLGAYASNQQANAYTDLANEYKGFGAPYRQRLSDLYADPNSFLSSKEVQVPVQQGTDIMARSLSTRGNPAGSGNALQQLQSYASDQLFGKLGQEKDRLAGFGGLANYNAAAPQAQSNAIGQTGNMYNAIGGGMADIFNPPKTAAQSLAELQRLMGGR